jgi:hypothetical protein
MERRTFVGASVASLCTAAVPGLAADAKPEGREMYELRVYSIKPAKKPLLDDYLGKALIPTLKRSSIGPVGVFFDTPEKDVIKVYVLIVLKSADQIADLPARLLADDDYRTAAAPFLAATAADPVYLRIECSLLSAISGMAKLEKPDATKPRLLNLRIYESHNERAAAKKVEMFDKSELAIFRRVGLTPVFFASTIVGSSMPNLTYMLAFPDEAGRKAAWDKFRADAEWLKLKAIPEYADKEIVSKITNKLLTPASYSEI